jgi:N-methylhydantoinase A/oxoprolinase/acetone carboxylase beta subunit
MLRVGVDVGGTNTDAVLMDGARLLAAHKAATSADIGGGVVAAIAEVLRQADLAPARLRAVMIGTTQFTNALVERRRLNSVGVIRIGLPAGRDIEPMLDWPAELRGAFASIACQVGGGYHYDGRPSAALDEAAVRAALARFREAGVEALAVSQTFAPVRADGEHRVAELAADILPGLPITLSSEIGRLGLIERENATIINAALGGLAAQVVGAFESALAGLGIRAPLFISQNDGTVMSTARARRYPVLTFASGPTNSMRGAAYLTGLKDAIVVDIGGTTTDVGALVNGFPRESSINADVGGVRTNFRMPDVLSIGLGGGSHVAFANGGVKIGPKSVGYELRSKARVFGGDVLTATDIAVAAGLMRLGDPARIAALPADQAALAMTRMRELVDGAIDAMKTSASALPVVLVGGGSTLVADPAAGCGVVLRPEHAGVANAIGAAIAQVSGEVERTLSFADTPRDAVYAGMRDEARRAAVTAGAEADSILVVDEEEIPLTYMPGDNVRIRIRVAGDLRL